MTLEERSAEQRLKHFSFILFGQVVSLLGSALTSFSLGVWAFRELGSVSAYSSIFFATAMGAVLTLPFAGSVVDRKDKKTILITSSLVSAVVSACIAALYFSDLLEVWHIVVLSAINGIAMAFSKPAITASVKILVNASDLTRANGMIASAYGVVTLLAPSMAGFLLLKIELLGILLIDLCTFIIGLVILSFLKLPKHELAADESIFTSVRFAWYYLKQKDALLWLIGFYFILNLLCAAIIVLIQPLILTFADAQALGMILTIAGLGYLFGAIMIGLWKGKQKKIYIILGAALFMGFGMSILPISTNLYVIALGAFMVSTGLPISLACNQAIIQQKVDSQYIGRVDGLGMLFINLAMPIGFLVAGPLAQYVFEPWMMESTTQNRWLVSIYGAGTGRGIALMVSSVALVLVMVVFLALMNSKIRRIETDLEDRD